MRAAAGALPDPAAGKARDVFTDPGCSHAALGTLLLDRQPESDPASVLGSAVGTRARREKGFLLFRDVLSGLVAAMARQGHRVGRVSCAEAGAKEGLVEALRRQRPVVVVADTFHLEHFWMNHGKTHALHSLVVREYDPADRTVRLTDPVDVVFLDERVSLAAVEAALFGSHIRQEWLSVDAWGVPVTDVTARPADLFDHVESLSGTGADEFSGTELVAFLEARLDDLFLLTGRALRAAAAHPWWIPHLQLGLWNYHHSLRWFTRYLRIGAATDATGGPVLTRAAAAAERASQDVLVVRALLRHGETRDPDRTIRYRDEVGRRLDRLDSDLRAAAAALAIRAHGGEEECP
ncbi:hypothetical protein STAFG_0198 [Streptomyces afghaniensis 772]|uniref:Butirosin biosynthesis protein H N-terminal domain-containing protein n=1 Tax=Streptomyces afghaniensis 772 TaxID=1283301 RepID=S4MT64_9ACTN|nr:hypothetical protein [Streptomyces afghaniensis]EPJ42748.1 hypothetical protein STAFG_0198 [Streptomyces afghaniensis 772]